MNARTTAPPAPPLPASVDLRDFDWMPLDVVRLRDSETASKVDPEAFRAAVLLWCAAWHQVPAASLPDDERELAKFAGFGRAVREWKRYEVEAMRGFVKCADGRLYHLVIAEKAATSWASKLAQRHITECATARKWNLRHPNDQHPVPSFPDWVRAHYPESVHLLSRGTSRNVQRDNPPMSNGTDPSCPMGQPPHVPTENAGTLPPREVKGYIPVVNTVGTRDSAAPISQTPRPKGRTSNPPRTAGDTPHQARIRTRGWKLGLEPRASESWDAFEARVAKAETAQ